MVITLLIKILTYVIILATSFLLANITARLCADEIVIFRKYFFALIFLSLLITIILFFVYFELSIILTLLYLVLFLTFIIKKSRNKSFVKKYA